jgi:hypothetical protein
MDLTGECQELGCYSRGKYQVVTEGGYAVDFRRLCRHCTEERVKLLHSSGFHNLKIRRIVIDISAANDVPVRPSWVL